MSGVVHKHGAAINEAVAWLSMPLRESLSRPLVPLLRERYGLSALEAIEAIRLANAEREAPDASP